jgi:hypothetical protein
MGSVLMSLEYLIRYDTNSFLNSFRYFLEHILIISSYSKRSQVPTDPRTMASTFTSDKLLLTALARSSYLRSLCCLASVSTSVLFSNGTVISIITAAVVVYY